MSLATRLLGVERAKLTRAPVTRVATVASVAVVAVTSVGGLAAARHSPGTDLGRKSASMITAPGWAGLTGLAATCVGVTTLLCAGVVMAWSVGRELTDGTVVGLFALPVGPGQVARAKVLVALAWSAGLALVEALVVAAGGVALGLPPAGAWAAGATVWLVGVLLAASALPVAWVATAGHGYLAGIAATLGLVVVTNVAAGFGLGAWLPWAVPVLWAQPHGAVGAGVLVLPAGAALAGAVACTNAWRRLQLGVR